MILPLLIFLLGGLSIPARAQAGPGYYGPGIQFDVLDNQQVAEGDLDYRFRAVASAAVTSFFWYDVYKKFGSSSSACDGYGCGTGGSVNICLFHDDGTANHLWTGKPLACVTDAKLRTGETIRREIFPAPAVLDSGALYHLHWHNTDPDPAKNFISVDDVCVWNPTTPRQPTIPDTDLAVLSNTRLVDTDSPIFQLSYANGAVQGQAYKESWSERSENISGPAMVRELFAPSATSVTVTGVSVRLNRIKGNQPLTATLATTSGTVIEVGKILAASFPMTAPLTEDAHANKDVLRAWGTYKFIHPPTLKVGQSYQLILSAPADTVFQEYGIQRASGYGFLPGTFFGDGRAQFTRDNGATWRGFHQSDDSPNHTDADIQFYFTTQ